MIMLMATHLEIKTTSIYPTFSVKANSWLVKNLFSLQTVQANSLPAEPETMDFIPKTVVLGVEIEKGDTDDMIRHCFFEVSESKKHQINKNQ